MIAVAVSAWSLAMRPVARRIAWAGWSVSLLLAVACFAVFVQGLARDLRVGEPVITLDPRAESDWRSASFRVWGRGSYTLRISSVNHDPRTVGRLFGGELEVRITAPEGRSWLHRAFPAGSTGHRVPDNYGDAALETLMLDDWPLRAWQLSVRVTKADPDFVAGRTQLALRKRRYDPGMGGMMNYAMIVPGAVFLLLALALSLVLARGGARTPLIVTALAAAAVLVLVA
jgi:hypothetical protein